MQAYMHCALTDCNSYSYSPPIIISCVLNICVVFQANGIEDNSFVKEMDYQVTNLSGSSILFFAPRALDPDSVFEKLGSGV